MIRIKFDEPGLMITPYGPYEDEGCCIECEGPLAADQGDGEICARCFLMEVDADGTA